MCSPSPHAARAPAALRVVGLLVMGTCLLTTAEAGMLIDPDRVTWSRLDFAASKLGLSTTSRVERRRLDAATAKSELADVEVAGGGLAPSGATERVEITTSFLGRRSRDSVLFAPGGLQTFQRTVEETGKRERFKVVRYGARGLAVERRKPSSAAEESLAPSRWTGSDLERVAYPPGTTGVQEPAVLLYLFSALDLQPGESETLTFFTDGEVHRAKIELDGLRQEPVSFEILDERGMTRVEGPRTLRRLTVTPESLGGRQGKLELLGLQGDLEVLVDLEHAVPVVIRGRVKVVGAVEIRLTRLERR